jgi:hypothetical protein
MSTTTNRDCCAAARCAELAGSSGYCVGHARVVQQFGRWLTCPDEFLPASEVPAASSAYAVHVGPLSFEACRIRWEADFAQRRGQQLT